MSQPLVKLPVVQPDRVHDLSPSAFRLWDSSGSGCARRFAFRYVDRLPRDDEDKPWFASGRNKHEYAEIARRARDCDYEHDAPNQNKHPGRYPKGWKPDDPEDEEQVEISKRAASGDYEHPAPVDHAFPGKYAQGWAPDDPDDPEQVCALAAIRAWPDCDWEPEVSVRVERPWGAWFGFSDQLGENYVGDYKFTGNRKNVPGWYPRVKDAELIARAAQVLRNDIQPIIYGNATTGSEDVDFQWTYVITPKPGDSPKVLVVMWTMSREELREKLEALDRSASATVTVKKEKTPGTELPNYPDRACQGVGIYCDYVASCDLFNERGNYEMSTAFDDLLDEVSEPKANPPESKERDVQATEDEIPKTASQRKKKAPKKPKAAPKGSALAGTIAFADARGTGARTATIELEGDEQIPVGARVELRLVG